MSVDARESALSSHICFNALATLQTVKNVENSCNFCSSSDHTTYLCPVLSKGEHVKDTSIDNLSWSSVPHGLQVYQDENGSHIISAQKFARGSRFGPLMAPKSYIPIENTKFPLKIFGTVNLDMEAMHMPELKDLFKVRHIHLDTRNEKRCNWMVHVDPAQYSNEQNLIAYEEDNEIFFAAVEDLDVGDILKVWYAPKYGERMKMPALCESTFPIAKNILRRSGGMGILSPDIQLFNSMPLDHEPNRTEIMLPSIKNIIKPSSYVCYEEYQFNMGSSYYPSSSPNYVYNSIIDPTSGSEASNYGNNSLLNLDDSFSTETEFTEFICYDDESKDVGKASSESGTSSSMASTQNGTDKEEKKVYPCGLCGKKYSTMTNIYRHVRAQHNCFLCSLCMKIFELEAELKEHMSKCPKSDEKKPQCSVCMQYFSNSWSLTRHLKIHVSAGECNADVLALEKKVKEVKKVGKDDCKENFDLSDIEKNSQDGFLLDAMGSMPETPTFEADLCNVAFNSDASTISDATLNMPIKQEIKQEIATTADTMRPAPAAATSAVAATVATAEKETEISSCVVCHKKFKSKSCINKHLRSVHAVRVLTGVKRSSSNHGHKSSSKRSYLTDSQSSITHTGSPVNPMTAKALASKLNERNNLLNGSKKTNTQTSLSSLSGTMMVANNSSAANDIPIPPLISIQTATTPTNRFKDGQQECTPMQPNKFSHSNNFHTQNDIANGSKVENGKHQKSHASSKQANGTNCVQQSKMASNNQLTSSPKLHKCEFCTKKFSKKYELKRHRTVHENIKYTCPYCEKEVKRKPSMLKHLRVAHKDKEHFWSDNDFIAQLKFYTKSTTNGFVQSESSNTNESSTDEKNNASPPKKPSASVVGSIDNGENVEIYQNVFLGGDASTTIIAAPAIIVNNVHTIPTTSHASEDEMTLLDSSSTADIVGNQKQSVVNMAAQASLNTIIDDCFFGEDALNCNVVLVHSPFSSDNDVDGFTMNNENGDCVMNKELLNEFHDRLEEMEEKVDSNDFKTIWDHVLDEDNLNDDMCSDDIDESVVV